MTTRAPAEEPSDAAKRQCLSADDSGQPVSSVIEPIDLLVDFLGEAPAFTFETSYQLYELERNDVCAEALAGSSLSGPYSRLDIRSLQIAHQ